MKGNRIITLLTIIFLIASFSCNKEKDLENDLPPNKMQVSEIDGVVGYLAEIDKFIIDVSIPGSYDSKVTGIVDDMPINFRTEGMIVVFSGLYAESSENTGPRLGGQSIYSLTLSLINTR